MIERLGYRTRACSTPSKALEMLQRGPMDIAVLEKIARGKNPSLAHRAAWMLTRHPSKSLEASYRGYLASKDEVLKAIAAYGLATVWM